MAKVQISIDEELLSKIDEQSTMLYMTRSGFIAQACAKAINENIMMTAIQDLSLTMRKIADNGEIGEEERKELEDFERIVKLLSMQK